MSSCARIKPKSNLSKNMAAVGAISDFSCYRIASETNETCLLSSPQCLVEFWSNDEIWHFGSRLLCLFDSMPTCSCASTETFPIWPFGSRLGRSEISHGQAGCRISSKTTGRIILGIGQNVPLNV